MAQDLVSKAVSGKGTIFSVSTAVVSPVYLPVAELKTFSFSGSKNDTEDVTNADSAGRAREFIVTLLDAGEIAVAGNYVSTDNGQNAFRTAFLSGALAMFKIVLPLQGAQITTGETMTFLGLVVENDLNIQFDKATSFSAKVKISGLITDVAGV